MSKKTYSLIIKGRHKVWSFTVQGTKEYVEDWREDGLEVNELLNTIPVWAANLGLTRIWIFVQDAFNFRFLDRKDPPDVPK